MNVAYLSIFIVLFLGLFQKRRISPYENNVYDLSGDNRSKVYLLTCLGMLIAMHTFINPYYNDLGAYTEAFYTVKYCSWSDLLNNNIPGLKAEVGYRLFTKFVSLFTSEEWVFLLCCSLVMFSGYYVVIKNYSPYLLLSILLITPNIGSMFILRQYMAMGLIFFSYPYIIRGRLIPFLVILAIAYSFHQTAIAFFPVYFLYNIKNRKRLYAVIFFSAVGLLLYLPYMVEFYSINYSMETAVYGDGYYAFNTEKGMNLTAPLLMTILLVFRLLVMKRASFEIGINKLLTIITIVGCATLYAGVGIPGMSRLLWYYTYADFIIFPSTLVYVKNSFIRFLVGAVYWAVMLYRFMINVDLYMEENLWFFSPNFLS